MPHASFGLVRRSIASLSFFALAACGHATDAAGGKDADSPAPGVDASVADAGLEASLGPDASPVPTPDASAPGYDASGSGHLRIMAANITSGSQQSYEAPGIRIFQGLAPDIVMLQEFKYAGGDLRSFVDTAFGPSFSFYVEARTGGIPNGIVSRYPILESGTWTDASVSDRAFAYARIDIPGDVDLWAVSLHLLTTGATDRAAEATQLLGYVTSAVPATDYLVLGGDLNTDTTGEQALTTFSSKVVVAPPYPVDQLGNPDTSTNRNRPHDWVMVSANLDHHRAGVPLGTRVYTDGLVFDSRVFTPITDVPPILAGDSASDGMQHMPVVKDFDLQGL